MSQRVLVFESDAAFAGEVKSNFERMGLAVDVAGDGPSGLELAAMHRPDLILLTIELPGMNGFLVCKKIKKTSELESVPLVILSSEVDQETFEQHKKLRTRADEYIRKPIAFADLLSRVQEFVPHTNGVAALEAGHDGAHAAAAEETALDIEEAFSVGDDDVIVLADDDDAADEYADPGDPTDPTDPGDQAEPPDDSTDAAAPIAFADTAQFSEVTHRSEPPPSFAFAATASEPEPSAPGSREPVMAPRVAPPPLLSFRPQLTAAEAAPISPPSAAGAFSPPPSAAFTSPPSAAGAFTPPPSAAGAFAPPAAGNAAVASAEFERMKREVAAADEKVQAAERRSALAEQRASSAEKALDTAKRTGGASSRELLDLREQLNRKDRELLELREQVTGRDKQIIEASDRSLAVERDLQDAREKSVDLQRELEKKNEVVAALTADKDSVRKRLDDTKARAERAEAKVRELDGELEALKTRHQSEVEGLRSDHSQALARMQQEHAAEVERLKQSAASELDALEKEHAAARTASQRAHADELSELREEHAVHAKAASERAEQEKRGALETLRHELTTLQQERLSEAETTHRNELASLRSELENRYASELAGVNDKHRQEVARLGKLLSEAESRHALLEERHEETESARANTESQLRAMTDERDQQVERNHELSGTLERARAKSARDEEILERVRRAMAIGLGLLEEQKQGSDG